MSTPNKKRIIKRERPDPATVEEAVREVLEHGQKINPTAVAFKISRAYLAKIVKKAKANPTQRYVHSPNIGNRRIFSTYQERTLVDYLKTASKMCHGLTRNQVQKLAFDYAQANRIATENWNEKKEASIDWLRGFMQRHNDLSIRTPESTSLSRATSFNKVNVQNFFSKVETVYEKYKFPPHMIFNCDETGCTTVTNPPKVIAERGCKQVGQITSAERGCLVTLLFFVSAVGTSLPPVFVFPRVHFKDNMLIGAPPGSLGLANSTGWMNEESFLASLKHFAQIVKPSKENPALLLMDNHVTHININVITFARENGIVILTFPPHCSHRLQPLDVSVYSSFKSRYRIAMNEWMLTNHGITVSIYQVAQFVHSAYLAAFSPQNITQGFRKTGIFPLNSRAFTEEDFLPSFVTDRPEDGRSDETTENSENNNLHVRERTPPIFKIPSNVYDNPDNPIPSTSRDSLVSPEAVRPFPKAGPRKVIRKKSRKMHSAVITDTPEKDRIEAITLNKEKGKNNRVLKKMKTRKSIKSLRDCSDTSDNDEHMSLHDDSDDSLDDLPLASYKESYARKKQPIRNKESPEAVVEVNNNQETVCNICKGEYSKSVEDWFQCKLCNEWVHDSCGHKGKLNFFCKICF